MRTFEIIGGIIPEAFDDDGLRQEREAGLLRAMADSPGCLLPWKLITAESSRCPFARENTNPYDEDHARHPPWLVPQSEHYWAASR